MQSRISAAIGVTTYLLLVLAASAFAADANSANSAVGSWILNPVKSHFENMSAPRMERLRILKDDGKVLSWSLSGFGADGKDIREEYDGPTDGSYHPITGGESVSTAAYTKSGSATNWTIKDKTGAIVETGSGHLSADGLTLTLKGTLKTPQGESKFTSVYDRVK